MTRARLGRARADRLLVDAARGGNLRTPLARAMGCRIVSYVDGGDFLLVMSDPLGWSGDRFDLRCTVPETLSSLLPGMRLGDVVSGTGSDDAIIATVERQGPAIVNASGRMPNPVEFPERDVLRIECELVDVRSIRLPLADRLLGPLRRTWGRCAWTWYNVFIKELGANVQSVNDLVFMTSMATMCLGGTPAARLGHDHAAREGNGPGCSEPHGRPRDGRALPLDGHGNGDDYDHGAEEPTCATHGLNANGRGEER